MAEPFTIHILSADESMYEGPCESVTVPSIDGNIGILARRANLVTAIVPGELHYRAPGQAGDQWMLVSHGLLRVDSSDVLVLVESAERPEEIDAARARRAAERAREAMLHKQSWQEHLHTQANLSRAMNRLKAAGRNR